MRYLIALGAFLFLNGAAHACLFARDAKPQDWYEWANVLFAADVTNIEQQNRRHLAARGRNFQGARSRSEREPAGAEQPLGRM